MIKVMLIDNEDLVRRGFRLALGETPDISVVADVRVGAEALRIARERRPRVILVDAGYSRQRGDPEFVRNVTSITRIVPTGEQCADRRRPRRADAKRARRGQCLAIGGTLLMEWKS